jgi:predicted nucleic acid-binding protein
MRVALDTSVVVRLLTGQPAAEAARARARVESAHRAGDDLLVTDLVAAETFHALRFHYRVPREDAATAIRKMVTSGLVRLEPEDALRAWTRGSAVRLVDRLVHFRHRSLDAVTWTLDRRQGRLDGATRI